ncbi:ATP cone domain-containing protein [Aurantibacillus circumpalustris]|uniref:ATP cone domain-containing protein n=1 Tax=Aurantibacillus circumpalustris TaxID=3036359 RepID=UPI00295B3597|nr:ATP cone domain-containing protein [Aurantibacillus circumpalustris]
MKPSIFVTKSTGKKEPFSIEKLRHSLERAKADPEEIKRILAFVTPQLYQGISTKQIHRLAFRLLRKSSRPSAARYHLKKGIMELGPSGFPFEKFVAKIFEHQNYTTFTDQILQGKCVSHEIDVVARKQKEVVLVECKYRNTAGIAVDIKTPLYIHARFEDVLANSDFKKQFEKVNGWVATNAKFTTDAIAYGRCQNMNLLSWDYPIQNGLKDIIDNMGLYPLTCLTSLTKQEKQWLMSRNYVLVNEIYKNELLLSQAGITLQRISQVTAEGSKLCEMLSNKTIPLKNNL